MKEKIKIKKKKEEEKNGEKDEGKRERSKKGNTLKIPSLLYSCTKRSKSTKHALFQS